MPFPALRESTQLKLMGIPKSWKSHPGVAQPAAQCHHLEWGFSDFITMALILWLCHHCSQAVSSGQTPKLILTLCHKYISETDLGKG